MTAKTGLLSGILHVVEGKVLVLTWTEQTDGWHANGLRIELADPFRWLVLDDYSTTAPVSLEEAPLAVTRTLTDAKREAGHEVFYQ